jgi:formylmethanofuran dehydrogenase subunit E
MDRCTADAVAHVTGVKLGRRSLKFMDYGINLDHLKLKQSNKVESISRKKNLYYLNH